MTSSLSSSSSTILNDSPGLYSSRVIVTSNCCTSKSSWSTIWPFSWTWFFSSAFAFSTLTYVLFVCSLALAHPFASRHPYYGTSSILHRDCLVLHCQGPQGHIPQVDSLILTWFVGSLINSGVRISSDYQPNLVSFPSHKAILERMSISGWYGQYFGWSVFPTSSGRLGSYKLKRLLCSN